MRTVQHYLPGKYSYMNRPCFVAIETRQFGRWVMQAMRPNLIEAQDMVSAHLQVGTIARGAVRYVHIETGEVLAGLDAALGATFAEVRS